MPSPHRGRRLLTSGATVLLSLLFCLLMVEVGLRIYARVTPNVDVEFVRYAHLMKSAATDSEVGFRHTPGARGTFFGVEVEINGGGFRDVESTAKPEDGVRIALLGDSVTFGWGVPYGERFSELLEEAWSGEWERPVELVNSGHGNYNTAQERATLVEAFDDPSIDGVLQVWYINDAEPQPPHRPAPWYSRLHSAVFLWAKSDLLRRRFGARESYEDYYRDLYRNDAPGFAPFVEALTDIGEWTRARDLPWLFVVLPEFHDFAADGPFAAVYEDVAKLARAAGAQVIDGTTAFRDIDPATVWVAYNDVHPNARGHAVITEAIRTNVDGWPWKIEEGR